MTDYFSESITTPIKILLVEDDRIDHLAFDRVVQQKKLPYDYKIAHSIKEAVDLLSQQTFAIAILDYNLGDGHSPELFPILKEKNCPFIILTGSGNEETAARLMNEGATDYLIKDPDRNYLKVLPTTVIKVLSHHQDKEQLRLLRYAIKRVKDSIYVADLDGTLLFVNNAFQELYNLNSGEYLTQSTHSLDLHLTQKCDILEDPCIGSNCGLEKEITVRKADDTEVPILLSESFIQDGSRRIVVGLMHDITLIKQAEAELLRNQDFLRQEVEVRKVLIDKLQESEERYRSVIASMTEGIVLQQADGEIIACNQSAERILGLSADQMQGLSSIDFERETIHEDGSPFPVVDYPAMVTLRTGEAQMNVIMGIRRQDRPIAWISINSQPLFHPDQELPYAVVASFSDITAQRMAQEILKNQIEQEHLQAMTDALTKVANRRCFDDRLALEWQRSLREKECISLIFLDIDYFKLYNDHYGHPAGDFCLIQVAQTAAAQLKRPTDLFARYGGEEFTVILPNTSMAGAIAVAQSMQHAIQALKLPHAASKVSQNLTISFGLASLIPHADQSPEDLVAIADNNLYQAKQRGRNQFYPSSPNSDESTVDSNIL